MAQPKGKLSILPRRDQYALQIVSNSLSAGSKSIRELTNILIRKGFDSSECENLLLEFVDYGILVIKRKSRLFDDCVLEIADAVQVDLQQLGEISLSKTSLPLVQNFDSSINLIVTLPIVDAESLETRLKESGVRFGDTLSAFRLIISEARKLLRISSPYVEENGMNLILDDLAEAMRHGVLVRMLVREVLTEPNTTRVKEALALVERLRRFGVRDNFEMREFHKVEKSYSGSPTKFVCSVHAKLLVADGRRAYVGSAELRRYGIKNNFEAGVLLGSRHAEALAAIFDSIFDISEVITDEKLKDVSRAI